jgi:hypothetical protein
MSGRFRMIGHIAIVALLFAGLIAHSAGALAQSSPTTEPTALEIVQAFWKLEVQGARLTPDGYSKTAGFFVDSELPRVYVMRLVVVSNGGIKENKLERSPDRAVFYNTFYEHGQIDSALRFNRTPERTAEGAWIKGGLVRYIVVLTDTQWEFDGISSKQVLVPKQWLIQTPPCDVHVTIDTAIRYVTEMREKATVPEARQNATRTLVILKRLRAWEESTLSKKRRNPHADAEPRGVRPK